MDLKSNIAYCLKLIYNLTIIIQACILFLCNTIKIKKKKKNWIVARVVRYARHDCACADASDMSLLRSRRAERGLPSEMLCTYSQPTDK